MPKEVTIFIDPVTRIEGHLSLRVRYDVDANKAVDAWSSAAMFRGFEVSLRGRYPESAIFITCRSCGVCGAAHANASVLACDMACGATPEPLGVILRNLAYAMTDYIYDHSVLLGCLEGPDYGCLFVRTYQPSVWKIAEETDCGSPYANIHGFKKVSDLLRAYNPIIGDPVTLKSIWRLTVYYQRFAKEAGSLIYGKYPHPATLIPGGIATDLTNLEHLITGYVFRLNILTAWVKFLVATWFELYWFFEDQVGYVQGKTYDPPIMLSAGLFDDPFKYSEIGETGDPVEIYNRVDEAYAARYEKPGVAFGKELVWRDFTKIQRNMVEMVTSGFYEDWRDKPRFVDTDPKGVRLVDEAANPEIATYHEWNKWTMPKPEKTSWEGGKYSWGCEVRIVYGNTLYPFEAGPLPKVWVHSLWDYESPHGLIKSGGGRIRITLPETRFYKLIGHAKGLPIECEKEVTFEWSIDEWAKNGSTTLARLLGRAYSLAMAVAVAWENILTLLEGLTKGEIKVKTSRPWKYPASSVGVGWCEAPRGAVRHWIVVRDGRIANYQYHAPTTGNVTPRTKRDFLDAFGLKSPPEGPIPVKLGAWHLEAVRGPYEAALLNTTVWEEETDPSKWIGLDFVRAIRSFDPCLGCTVHVELTGKVNRVIKKYLSPAYHSL